MALRLTITPARREEIFQTYLLCGSKKETATKCAVSPGTVIAVLKEYKPEEISRARQEAMAEIAARVNDKVLMAIEALTPDDFKAKAGKGPSLMQKTTALAILVDKRVLLEKAMLEYEELQKTASASQVPLPADVPAMVAAIQNSMRVLGIAASPEKQVPAVAPEPPVPEPETVRNITLDDLDFAGRG